MMHHELKMLKASNLNIKMIVSLSYVNPNVSKYQQFCSLVVKRTKMMGRGINLQISGKKQKKKKTTLFKSKAEKKEK